jgi:hypothetical protein
MQLRILAIDPGISGALALLELEQGQSINRPRVVEVLSMPTMARKKDGTGEAVNSAGLADAIARLRPEIVVLEQASAVAAPRDKTPLGDGKVQKQHGMGVAGAFNFGVGYGVIIGCCARLPKYFVTPASWKKRMKVPSSRDNKDYARTLALALFPYLSEQLERKKDVGRAEAILIGMDYCQQLVGELGHKVTVDVDVRKVTPHGYTMELQL